MRYRLALALSLLSTTALAQINPGPGATPTGPAGTPNAKVVSIQGISGMVPIDVNGTFSASIGGFLPTPAYTAAISVSSVNTSTALPTNTGTVVVYNVGSKTAYTTLAAGAATATTAKDAISAGGCISYVTTGFDHLGSITAGSDTTTLNVSGGSGLGPNCGGGGGGGSGGSVTITSPLGHGTADAAAVSIVPSATASFPVTGTFWQATQPVSGTVTANAGTNLNTANIESYTSRLLSGALPTAGGAATSTTAQAVGGTYNATPISLTDTQQAGIQLTSDGSVKVSAMLNTTPTLANGNGVVLATAAGAAIDATHGSYTNLLQGNVALGTTNPIYAAITDGTTKATVTVGGNLNVQCANCSGSGVSTADEAAFSAGSSLFAGGGGFFQTTATSNALTNGQQGMFQVTAQRALFTNLRTSAGAETGVAASPLQVSLANTGANSTAVKVDGTGGTFVVTQSTASSLNATVVGTGTFATQSAITAASGSIQSGAIASGAIASGAIASGAISANAAAVGAFPTGAIADLALAQNSTTAGQVGNLVLTATTTSAPSYTTARSNPLSTDTAGNLRVTGVGGTFVVTQSTASSLNATVVGTGTFATQSAITAASSSFSSGAFSSGAFASGSIASGAIASGALAAGSISSGAAVIGAFVSGAIADLALAQGATTSGKVGNMILGSVTTAAPTYTTAQLDPLSLDTSGNLRVNCLAGCSGTSATDTGTFTQGSSNYSPVGGFYNSAITNLTSGQGGAVAMTAARSMHVLDDNSASLLAAAQAGTTTTGSAVTGSQINMGVSSGGNSRQWTASNPTGSVYAGQIDQVAVNGTTILAGAGVTGTGSPRVTVAQDTTTVAGTQPFSGATGSAVPATGSYEGINVGGNLRGRTGVNPTGTVYAAQSDIASVAGTTASVGAGAVGNGSIRVAVGTDTSTIAGSAPSTVLQANVAQINGVTTLMGNGVTGTGSQRVTIASDNTPFLVKVEGNAGAAFDAATGAAPPANALLTGTLGGGATGGHMNGLIQADSSAAINVSTATTTEIVALSSGRKIYVTSFDVIAGGTGNITFEYGTGTACASGTTVLTGAYPLTAQSGIAKGGGLGPVLVVPAGNALCVLTSQAVQMSGSVSYAQF